MRIAICDDDNTQVKALKNLLYSRNDRILIDEYNSGEQFLFEYEDNPCDLLLLDIEMDGINGMELAKKLRSKGDMLPIIFITGFSEYMSDGYDVEALHYLLKPVDSQKLFSVLDKYLSKKQNKSLGIIVKTAEATTHISFDDIIYIEAQGRKTLVKLISADTLECENGIGYLSDKLSDSFVRCHRSYIVNLRYVRSIGKTEIALDSGESLPLSRRLYKEINDRFIGFYTR
ncbi:MAG: LytR/AlgR family response regulator transcription factor [Oscillospiraceae bacterium]